MIGYLIGRIWLLCFGWKAVGRVEHAQFVLIAAPHTTNWDLPFTLAAALVLRVRIKWLGKRSLFRGPLGWFFRALGGLPVDRDSPQNLVAELVERFSQTDNLVLTVAVEGSRRKVAYWRSGFYRIALGAGVPIGLGFLDYRRKMAGIGGYFVPTGHVSEDMDKIRAFYQGIRGKYPELETAPRLREECEGPDDASKQPAS